MTATSLTLDFLSGPRRWPYTIRTEPVTYRVSVILKCSCCGYDIAHTEPEMRLECGIANIEVECSVCANTYTIVQPIEGEEVIVTQEL